MPTVIDVQYDAPTGRWIVPGTDLTADSRGLAWYFALRPLVERLCAQRLVAFGDTRVELAIDYVSDKLYAHCMGNLPATVTRHYFFNFIGWRIRDARIWLVRHQGNELSLDWSTVVREDGADTSDLTPRASTEDDHSLVFLLEVLPDGKSRQIASLLAEGYSYRDVASTLKIPLSSLSSHIAAVMRPALAAARAA